MKRNISIRKITSASLALLISVSYTSAMEKILKSEQEGKEVSSKGLRDHNYYKEELRKLEESTAWIHKEVERILMEFKKNMKEYYMRTRGARTITPQAKIEENAKPDAGKAKTRADVIENVQTLADIKQYIVPNTLVLLDVDDTMMTRSFKTQEHQLLENNLSDTLTTIHNTDDAEIVGFTHRSMNFDKESKQLNPEDAYNRLKDLGIDMAKFGAEDLRNDEVGEGFKYMNGMFYAAMNPKDTLLGQILTKYASKHGKSPDRIIFADDAEDTVRKVSEAARKLNIDSICMIYTGGLEDYVKAKDAMKHLPDNAFLLAERKEEEILLEKYRLLLKDNVELLRQYEREAKKMKTPLEDYLQMLSDD